MRDLDEIMKELKSLREDYIEKSTDLNEERHNSLVYSEFLTGAKQIRLMMDAFVEAGFEPEKAFDLTKICVKAAFKNNSEED